jgi:Ser/Thr protein kinase RdoA (MazF antagonist)
MNVSEDRADPTTVESPDFSAEAVAAVVADEFDLRGDYCQLISERDQNFRLKSPDGRKFVVKVTSLIEDRVATDFQIAMLSHFEECGFDYTPRVVTTASGRRRVRSAASLPPMPARNTAYGSLPGSKATCYTMSG